MAGIDCGARPENLFTFSKNGAKPSDKRVLYALFMPFFWRKSIPKRDCQQAPGNSGKPATQQFAEERAFCKWRMLRNVFFAVVWRLAFVGFQPSGSLS